MSTPTQIVVATVIVLTVAAMVGTIANRQGAPHPASPLPIGEVALNGQPPSSQATSSSATVTERSSTKPPATAPAEPAAPTTITTVPPGAVSPSAPYAGPPPLPPVLDAAAALAVLTTLPVADEHLDGYDRDLFAVWTDLDGDGCDPRADTLIAESLTPAQVDPFGCFVVAGDWLSAYDGLTFDSPADLDVDHLVPLQEAWRSGAWAWSVQHRIDYANDVTDQRTLAAVSSSVNRSKGDSDPARWLPIDDAKCTYLLDWIAVKARWSMAVDAAEVATIRSGLERCG